MIDVRCPKCGECAKFTPIGSALIDRRSRPYFEASPDFEVVRIFDNGYKPYAVYYHGLRRPLFMIADLPAGFAVSDFKPKTGWPQEHPSLGMRKWGSVVCNHCGARQRHNLNWPDEAWFSLEYRGKVLWAPDQQMATKLLNYIAAGQRNKTVRGTTREGYATIYTEDWFLRRIPTHFLTAKARPHIVKKFRNKFGLHPIKEPQS